MQSVLVQQLLHTLSGSNLAGEVVEMHELVRELPRRAHTLLRNLSENRFRIDIGGLEETRMIENMQKIANRISAGLITAALIVAGALIMRIETRTTLFGYPAFALVLFTLAAALGFTLILSSLRRDRTTPPREESHPK